MTKATLPPTPRQRDVERFIQAYVAAHDGVSPSFAEIAAGLNMTVQAAHGLVKGLINRGRVTRGGPWQPRSLQLVEERRETA